MIHLTPSLLPEDQQKRIREWFQQPAATEFINWLADRAALFTARAGNALTQNDQGAADEARVEAEEGREYLTTHTIMIGVMTGTIKLEVTKMTPKPISKE